MSYVGQECHGRKLRLFACACLRRVAHFANAAQAEALISTLERYADGAATEAERIQVAKAPFTPNPSANHNSVSQLRAEFRYAARKTIHHSAPKLGVYATGAVGHTDIHHFHKLRMEEENHQLTILREIFGNPFRPITFDPAWRTSDVMLLANGIYAERAFDRMPILADALQDAGCDSDAILNHLRDANATHVRGCWALDLVLGKE
jgi:hypothetical protein